MLATLSEKANNLPQLPGVYLMLDEHGDVIYVGKAKKLKNRVSSYFHGDHLPKVEAMVQKVRDFNVIVANSEFEALILENSLIKQHKPHYNILLKDDKGYPFIRLDRSRPYPRFEIVSRVGKDKAQYFGPYGGRSITRGIIETISKTLLLPDCTRRFPEEIGRERPCLNYHMNTCAGWCRPDSVTEEEYDQALEQAVLILEGRTDDLLEELNAQMESAAEELHFELAASLRDRIYAIQDLSNKQRVISTVFADTDVLGFARSAPSCFAVLHYRNGNLTGKDVDLIEEPLEEDGEAVSSYLRQYYGSRSAWPKTILVPADLEDREDLEAFLTQLSGHKVALEFPQRGERVRLVETASMNAKEEVLRRTTENVRRSKTLELLQKALAMDRFPERIEAYDISNLGSTGIVAGMTVHKNGKPSKKDYRKFRIRDLDGPDDYESMRQVIARRARRYLDGDEKFMPLPDLFLIDGGDTHAEAAEQILRSMGISVPVWGMVKDDRHRTRALINAAGEEISISSNQALFALIGNIQEETHRFSIEYQRSLRMENYTSQLDKIPGVGEKRRNQLLNYFKTVKAVKEASLEELSEAVPVNTARAVYEYYHSREEESP